MEYYTQYYTQYLYIHYLHTVQSVERVGYVQVLCIIQFYGFRYIYRGQMCAPLRRSARVSLALRLL